MHALLEILETPAGMFGAWLVVQAALLVWEPQMWRPHVSEVIVPIALLVALRPPSWRVTAVVVVLALPWYVVNVHTMLWPQPYRGDDAAAVARIRAFRPARGRSATNRRSSGAPTAGRRATSSTRRSSGSRSSW